MTELFWDLSMTQETGSNSVANTAEEEVTLAQRHLSVTGPSDFSESGLCSP